MAPKESPFRVEPTPQEAFFFLNIIKHTRNKVDVDWDEVSTEMGYANGNTAKVCLDWRMAGLL